MDLPQGIGSGGGRSPQSEGGGVLTASPPHPWDRVFSLPPPQTQTPLGLAVRASPGCRSLAQLPAELSRAKWGTAMWSSGPGPPSRVEGRPLPAPGLSAKCHGALGSGKQDKMHPGSQQWSPGREGNWGARMQVRFTPGLPCSQCKKGEGVLRPGAATAAAFLHLHQGSSEQVHRGRRKELPPTTAARTSGLWISNISLLRAPSLENAVRRRPLLSL